MHYRIRRKRRLNQLKRMRPLLLVVPLIAGMLLVAETGNPLDRLGTGSSENVRVLRGGDAWSGIRPDQDQRPQMTARTISGRVTHVRDGDTIEVRGTPVRIANLDCAERGTSAGTRATTKTRQLVRSEPVTCSLSGKRSYDRMVGRCKLTDGRDIGQVMVSGRFCSWWR